MIQVIKNKYIVFAVLFLIGIYYVYTYLLTCKIYGNFSFDSQALLAWDYSAFIGQLPYRDVFYPYGLLFYFKSSNILLRLIYFSTPFFLIGVLFFIFSKVSKSRIRAFIGIFAFVLFIHSFTDIEVFIRYGSLVTITLLFSYFLHRRKENTTTYSFQEGLISGITLSLITDIGIYSYLIYLSLQFFYPLLKRAKGKELKYYYGWVTKRIGLYSLGYFLGTVPFFLYLAKENIFLDFWTSLYKFSEIALYAKTPFFPYSDSIENIFTIGFLVLVISLLAIKILYRKDKLELLEYTQLGLVLSLLFLEQKSIIRSLDRQLVFIGILLFLSLLQEILINLKKKKISKYFQFSFCLVILYVLFFQIGLHPLLPIRYEKNLSLKACIEYNVSYLLAKDQDYFQVQRYLQKMDDFNGKVYSFPADPIFYILFKQNSPYYTNIYDGSSEDNQRKTIEYLRKEDVQIVVINTNIASLQDGVPDYIRGNTLLKYIVTHYKPEKEINRYILLRKTDLSQDFFTSSNEVRFSRYTNYLLHVELAHIPFSEGLYKSSLMDTQKKIFHFNSKNDLNTYLEKHPLDSDNILMSIKYISRPIGIKESDMVLTTEKNINTHVVFDICNTEKPCLIHLSRIPLFFTSKKITSINFLSGEKVMVDIYRSNGVENLW